LAVAYLPYFPLLSGILTGKYRRGEPLPEGARVTGSDRWRALLTDEVYDLLERLTGFAEARGRELLDLAFAYLLAQAPVASVIAGATRPEQVRRNVEAGSWELSAEELAEVTAILDRAGEVVPR
jgi:aryl-alcohol dehydrogenase-like predicted oxidoreductase